MAAGITQPGGAGTTIQMEDNTNADADLDVGLGVDLYTLEDIVLKGLASGDAIDLGTNPADKAWRLRASLQNGDNVGSQPTTLRGKNCTVCFDATKTYSVSTVGASNRRTEFGDKITSPNGKPGGKNGIKFIMAATSTWRGQIFIYGSLIATTVGNINLIPGINAGEIINAILQAPGTFAIGQSTTGNLSLVYNLDIVCTSASPANVIANWGADQAERVTVECSTPQRFISTGAVLRIRDLVLIGAPTITDLLHSSTSDWDLIEPVYSGAALQIQTASAGRYVNEWWRWLPILISASSGASKIANVPVRLLDLDGVDLLGSGASAIQYTDSQGLIAYNPVDPTLTIFDNVIKARRFVGGASAAWEGRGPFTARFNLDGAILPGYLGTQFQFDFPRRIYGAAQEQLSPVLDVVRLQPRGGVREEWRSNLA